MNNVMSCHADKQGMLLADVNISLPLGACQIMCLFNVLHREMKTAAIFGFIYDNFNRNV